VTIADTTISNNSGAGIVATASGSGLLSLSLSRVKAVSNGYSGSGIGVRFTGVSASYGYLAIDSSFIAENATGLVTSATTPNEVTAFVTNSAIVNNVHSLNVGAATSVTLEKTSIGSIAGGQITNHGAVISFGDNAIIDSVSGTPITTQPLQ
jgi:hypothetical protein